MGIGQSFLPEYDVEMGNTRRVLQQVTDEILDWKAHEKSNSIRWVASHLAEIPGWLDVTFHREYFDVAPPGGPSHVSPMQESVAEIVKTFDENVASGREILAAADDASFAVDWSLIQGGQVLWTMPRTVVVRQFVLNHSIHHRGHLCVYLRMNDIAVPGLYGPSADEDGSV